MYLLEHRRSPGMQWCAPAPLPRAETKIFRRNLEGKFVSAPPAHQVHPQAEQESILGHFLLGAGDLEVEAVHFSSFRPSFEGDD